jgi:hypothetical protein
MDLSKLMDELVKNWNELRRLIFADNPKEVRLIDFGFVKMQRKKSMKEIVYALLHERVEIEYFSAHYL